MKTIAAESFLSPLPTGPGATELSWDPGAASAYQRQDKSPAWSTRLGCWLPAATMQGVGGTGLDSTKLRKELVGI